ncbi:MAG: phosphomannomutase [Desulfovibrio sp.]|nr:phosphomannomutase [Desulfovibrio sp.]
MDHRLASFKAYDIRGRVPENLDAELAFALGRALAEVLPAHSVVVGRDVRLSGPVLRDALVSGLSAAGVHVTDIGLCGTEEIYHAAARPPSPNAPFDAGVMITGSHNPADENGFKIVRGGAIPVSGDSGLYAIRDRVEEILHEQLSSGAMPTPSANAASFRSEYVRWLLRYSGFEGFDSPKKRLKIVADSGNGCAGLVLSELTNHLPFEIVPLHWEPDGHFPNGVPNPLLPERRAATSAAVREAGADMGVAWDGDFDRCFLYDGEGRFIEGYYCVGLLAAELLRGHPGAKIVHDPRVYWNTREMVLAAGGRPVMGKTGHAFIKERMRAEDALYGGEMSAHHYFRDFAYCDSGMLPWLLVASLLQRTGRSLAELVAERMNAYPCSGEINRRVSDPRGILERLRDHYAPGAVHEDRLDGINLEFPNWRFNVRMSNTEPLLRLNVETRGDRPLLEDKTAELLKWLEDHGAIVA